jgi:hypothetical protein
MARGLLFVAIGWFVVYMIAFHPAIVGIVLLAIVGGSFTWALYLIGARKL